MLYWYDYETLGPSPRRDRPAQFAGLRTDEDLNVVGEPLVLYCKPTPDYLPVPESCLVHGISPAKLINEGIPPSQFASRIHDELSEEGTCGVGYNAMSFDHEFTRFLFYRNLIRPYTWHYDQGCSRWDVIDLLRAAFALRPEGIEWPRRDDGTPSFKLVDIAKANGILQESAHDALSDVLTTIEVARLIRRAQPKLYSYYFDLRLKQHVWPRLKSPSVYVSGVLGAEKSCATVVAPVCRHPQQKNRVIAFDVRQDPAAFADLSAEEIARRLFTRREGLSDGVDRPPLYQIGANASPFLAPIGILDQDVQNRLDLDVDKCLDHAERLRTLPRTFADAVQEAYDREWPESDVDEALYDDFIPDSDRTLLDQLLEMNTWNGETAGYRFSDKRLPELVFRYRSRNHGEHLSPEDAGRWRDHCRRRHLEPDAAGFGRLDRFEREISSLRQRVDDSKSVAVLDGLSHYGQTIRKWLA